MKDSLVGVAVLAFSIAIPPSNSSPNQTLIHHHSTKKPVKPFLSAKLSPSLSASCSPASRPPLLSTVRWLSSSRKRTGLKYFADLASKLAEEGKFQDFLMIAESVVVSGVKPRKFANLLNVELVSVGIAKMLDGGKVWSVVEVLTVVERLAICAIELFDESAMEALQRECIRTVKCGRVEKVLALMEVLAGFRFSIKKLMEPAKVIELCVNRRNPSATIRYVCIFSHAHTLFCDVIHEFGKKKDLVSALTVFEASKQNSDSPNMYAYRTIIDVCGQCGDYLKSRSIFKELLGHNVTPNVYVFNSLMNVNAHDLSYTLHVYKHMQSLGIVPDIASYNILLKSFCLAERVDLAQEVYQEVQLLQGRGILKLDVFTYSTIVKVFADAKMWQMALKVKEDMLSAGVNPNTITWSSLINACANAGLVEQAIQLFEEMLLAGCKPNAQCCNILLHACVEACQYDRAFRIFQTWKRDGFRKVFGKYSTGKTDSNTSEDHHAHDKCSNVITNRISDLNRLSLAMRVPFTPTTSTYNILMKACGTDYHRAKALMDEMETVGLSPNQISCSILIDICGGSGNVEGAMQILKSMRTNGIRPDVVAYTTAIKVCVENKKVKLAFSLFSEMKRYHIQPNMVTYNTLLRARKRYGSLEEVQQCLSIYQDMRKAGYKSNDYYLKQLIEEWCEGVIQDNNHYQCKISSRYRNYLGKPHSLLLEKVAVNLKSSNAENLRIDLQGLTKVEARIVLLAVLRMIKEKYFQGANITAIEMLIQRITLGDSIKDDMHIILGFEEIGTGGANQQAAVKEAVIKLLQNELGLEVLLSRDKTANYRKINPDDPPDWCLNSEDFHERKGTGAMLYPSARRPAILHRLKVTRESLYDWLQRGSGDCPKESIRSFAPTS